MPANYPSNNTMLPSAPGMNMIWNGSEWTSPQAANYQAPGNYFDPGYNEPAPSTTAGAAPNNSLSSYYASTYANSPSVLAPQVSGQWQNAAQPANTLQQLSQATPQWVQDVQKAGSGGSGIDPNQPPPGSVPIPGAPGHFMTRTGTTWSRPGTPGGPGSEGAAARIQAAVRAGGPEVEQFLQFQSSNGIPNYYGNPVTNAAMQAYQSPAPVAPPAPQVPPAQVPAPVQQPTQPQVIRGTPPPGYAGNGGTRDPGSLFTNNGAQNPVNVYGTQYNVPQIPAAQLPQNPFSGANPYSVNVGGGGTDRYTNTYQQQQAIDQQRRAEEAAYYASRGMSQGLGQQIGRGSGGGDYLNSSDPRSFTNFGPAGSGQQQHNALIFSGPYQNANAADYDANGFPRSLGIGQQIGSAFGGGQGNGMSPDQMAAFQQWAQSQRLSPEATAAALQRVASRINLPPGSQVFADYRIGDDFLSAYGQQQRGGLGQSPYANTLQQQQLPSSQQVQQMLMQGIQTGQISPQQAQQVLATYQQYGNNQPQAPQGQLINYSQTGGGDPYPGYQQQMGGYDRYLQAQPGWGPSGPSQQQQQSPYGPAWGAAGGPSQQQMTYEDQLSMQRQYERNQATQYQSYLNQQQYATPSMGSTPSSSGWNANFASGATTNVPPAQGPSPTSAAPSTPSSTPTWNAATPWANASMGQQSWNSSFGRQQPQAQQWNNPNGLRANNWRGF